MNEAQVKQTFSLVIFHASTIKLLTDEPQVLLAVARIENIIGEMFKANEVVKS
jgi:hypothetical protein